MIFKNVKYLLTTHTIERMPKDEIPEIAIVGRSNVGKSTLVNILSNQRNMAYISSKPGKTRGISFFDVNKTFRLVDLPGYGFAKVSQTQKQLFGEMMEEYFNKRANLFKVIILIDVRRSFTPDDLDMINFLIANEITFQILGTKLDKAKQSDIHKFNKESSNFVGTKPLMISAHNKKNIDKLGNFIWSE